MQTKRKHGGLRQGSGRPFKEGKSEWGQITCVLKKATIDRLKAGAASKHFGEYLQYHLDRYPLPSRETYLALINNEPITVEIKRGRKVPVLISVGGTTPLRLRPRHNKRPLSLKEFEEAIVAAGSS